jgi:diguanylate cyclase (GGDEF)-like protein
VIEDGMVPGWLARTGRWLAGTSVAAGVMAAADGVLPVMPFDRLLTYTIAGCLVVLAIACGYAIRRGSRIVWLYLIGWAPVIGIFVTRLLRNLGLVGQSDLIDQATFLALGFEALVFSLVIANRFRRLQRQLNHAARKRAMQQAETEALRRAAETDFLTGLGNRAAYHRTVRALVDRGDGFTLWLIDIDHLKQVNDRLGHAAGDALITAIGQALRSLRAEAGNLHAARIGGDEFAVVMPGDPPMAAAVLARLAALQGLPWLFEEQQRPLSMSIGSARFPADGRDADMLYHHADLALYTAKNTGRGRHHAYDPLLGILRELQTDFSADGEGALARGEFLLHFQPIVALPGGRPCGYEALLRWDHPIRGLLLPDRFAGLLVSEQVGPRIQYHVLDLAIAWIDRRRDAGMVCVNFTATPLGDPDAVRHILARLAAHDVPPAMLCIEVTEGVMLDRSAEAVLATLTALHDAGVGIALDDFGIGVASLAHLRRMPIDRIKIDRSFVTALDGDGGGAAAAVVVRAIIGLATGLGKAIVAEGIETVAQARLLAEMGCPLGQGFLYGRPVPDGGIAVARPAPVAATSH